MSGSISKSAVALGASCAAAAGAVAFALLRSRGSRPKPHPALDGLPDILKLTPTQRAIMQAMFSLPMCITKHLLPAPDGPLAKDKQQLFGLPALEEHHVTDDFVSFCFEVQSDKQTVKSMTIQKTELEKLAATAATESERHRYQKDLEICERVITMPEAEGEAGGWLKAGLKSKLHAAVMRGPKTGKVVLFNPIRITPEVRDRIIALFGGVDWIITGSAFHTRFAKSTADAFPDAKWAAPWAAAVKIGKVGIHCNIDYTNPKDLADLEEELAPDFRISYAPDPVCHSLSLMHCKSGILCEVDLYYHNPKGLMNDDDLWTTRAFYHQYLYSSPNKLLPCYRFPALLGGFFPVVPSPSPDCLSETSAALKELIALPFMKVWSAHAGGQEIVSGDTFRAYISNAWIAWLDNPDSLLK